MGLGDVGNADAMVCLLAKHGVDGIVVVNTQKDYSAFTLPSSDKALLQHYTSKYDGGLSGAPIKDRSLQQASSVVAAVRSQGLQNRFAVIHVGGLASQEDVLRSRQVGAPLRQWYTGFMNALADGAYAPKELYPKITASQA